MQWCNDDPDDIGNIDDLDDPDYPDDLDDSDDPDDPDDPMTFPNRVKNCLFEGFPNFYWWFEKNALSFSQFSCNLNFWLNIHLSQIEQQI